MKPRRIPSLAVALLVCVLATGCGRLESLSTAEALERLTVATSKVYDAKGEVIADLHGEINRDITKLNQIPKHVRDAVVAVEDERFWQHQGLDLRSITRAVTSNFRSDTGTQGGSTISQQLAKNLYFGCISDLQDCEGDRRPVKSLARKIAEARVTWQLERQYTKTEILEMYLNTIYLGRGRYGVETAAQTYFGKSVSDLDLAEGAFLAGLIHEPARYEWSPSDPPERRKSRAADAKTRRNYVIDRMVKTHVISTTRAANAKRAPLLVQPIGESRWEHPYFVDLVLRQLGVLRNNRTQVLDPRFDFLGTTPQERSKNVYLGGLRIYTTLDPRAQVAAEDAVKLLPDGLDRLSVALAAIEPSTGYVRALIGGRDYYPDCEKKADQKTDLCRLAKLNLAIGQYGGGSGRQAGSSFKPFVLTAALERGIPLYATYPSDPFTYPIENSAPWKVDNYDGAGGGNLTVVDGTARSVNAVYARLEVEGVGDGDAFDGAARVAETARRMGISFPTPEQLKDRCGKNYLKVDSCIPADRVPAIALGAKEVDPFDMASAYSALANDGTRVEPTAIVRIEDADGRVVYDADPARVRAVAPGVARGVTYALQQVFNRGTGTAAKLDRPSAGKTGTSQGWRDAWLAGYTPQLAAVVWVGNPCPSPCSGIESMVPSNGYPRRITGGSYPAQIWHAFMTGALAKVKPTDFRPPPSVLFRGGARVAESPDPSASPDGSGDSDEPDETDAPSGTVPSVIGQSFGDAGSTLRNAGYDPQAVRGCDPDRSADLHEVYSQTPDAGDEALAGTTVTFYYEAGDCD
jgi:penicillin-binding protein 1A